VTSSQIKCELITMEYPPPDSIVYSGIQFNPSLFETTADKFNQASIGLLNTDNIQGIAPADTISLYTLSTGFINLGSNLLNTITTRAIDFAMYGNLNIRNFAGTQVIGYGLNLANTVSQVFYSDGTTPTLSAALSVTPNTVGDTVIGNGNFIVDSGEARFVSLRLNKFQAPFHYFYDAAALLYSRIAYTASSMTQIFYCDPANITVGSAVVLVSPDTLTPTVSYRGNYEIRTGKLNLNANTSITAGAPILPDYNTSYAALTGATTTGAIGQMYSAAYTGGLGVAFLSGNTIKYGTLPALGPGVWLLNFYGTYDITAATQISAIQAGLFTAVIGSAAYAVDIPMTPGTAHPIASGKSFTVTGVICIPSGSTATYYGTIGATFTVANSIKTATSSGVGFYSLTATRLA